MYKRQVQLSAIFKKISRRNSNEEIKNVITNSAEYGLIPQRDFFEDVYKRQQCGKPFPTDGKRVYCSQRCAEEARRKQTAARVRKYREKQQQM